MLYDFVEVPFIPAAFHAPIFRMPNTHSNIITARAPSSSCIWPDEAILYINALNSRLRVSEFVSISFRPRTFLRSSSQPIIAICIVLARRSHLCFMTFSEDVYQKLIRTLFLLMFSWATNERRVVSLQVLIKEVKMRLGSCSLDALSSTTYYKSSTLCTTNEL